MKNFNEQTGELRVNDVLTTTFNEQTGVINFANSTSSQTENLYTEEDMMEYAVWLCIETNSASGRNRTSKDLLSEWVKQTKKD